MPYYARRSISRQQFLLRVRDLIVRFREVSKAPPKELVEDAGILDYHLREMEEEIGNYINELMANRYRKHSVAKGLPDVSTDSRFAATAPRVVRFGSG